MLTLKRRETEALILETSDGKVSVLITRSMRGKIKISINAPSNVKIYREAFQY